MNTLQSFLRSSVIWMELLAALVGFYHLFKYHQSPWKWFVYYLLLMFVFESVSYFFLDPFAGFRKYYYGFLVIPIQFLFFYWLYAYVSLNKSKYFWIFSGIYLLSVIPNILYPENTRVINSLSYSIGVLLLLVLVVMEFFKQIQSDHILNFSKNIMFYINIGVVLFYVGTLPFFALDAISFEYYSLIWARYYTLFLVLVNLMYLIFSFSLIWGKPNIY
jgi:hypothetical protein